MKLYRVNVSISCDMLVWASDAACAEEIAEDNYQEELDNNPSQNIDFVARPIDKLEQLHGDEGTSLPWVDAMYKREMKKDQTCQELLEEAAAKEKEGH